MTPSRQRDLAAYYDAEAEARVRSDLSERRSLHEQSVELFRREGAQTIVDVGAGSGLAVRRFRSEGFDVVTPQDGWEYQFALLRT